MVLIAERAIIDIICVMIVFNKAKYHIYDNNEFASYLLRHTVKPMQERIALLICSSFFLFFLLIFQCILSDLLQLLGKL